MNPDYPNGVTDQMMEAGAPAFLQGPYVGVAINVGNAGTVDPKVLDTPSAIGIALARAFPAMADKLVRWQPRHLAASRSDWLH